MMISHTSSVLRQVVPSDPGSRGILMHSALPVEACSSLEDAPLLDSLCSVNTRFCLSLFRVHKYESLCVRPGSFVKVAHNKCDGYRVKLFIIIWCVLMLTSNGSTEVMCPFYLKLS